MIKVSDLDKRICDVEPDCINDETYRHFITTSEEDFCMDHADIDHMTDDELNKYIEFIDFLWTK